MALHVHGDPQPLPPGTRRQVRDLLLAAEEPALAVLGVQQKALEVSEPVIDQARDLAREIQTQLALGLPGRSTPPPPISGGRREDLRRVSAKRLDAIPNGLQIAMEDRIPTAALGDRLRDPTQYREVSLLGQQQRRLRPHRARDLESSQDPAPT